MPILNIIPEGNVSKTSQRRARRYMCHFPNTMLNNFSNKKWSVVILGKGLGFDQSRYFDGTDGREGQYTVGKMDPDTRCIGVLEDMLSSFWPYERDDVLQHEFGHFLYQEFLTRRYKEINYDAYIMAIMSLRGSMDYLSHERFQKNWSEGKSMRELDEEFKIHDHFITMTAIKNPEEFFAENVAAYFNNISTIQEKWLEQRIIKGKKTGKPIDRLLPTRNRIKNLHPHMIPLFSALFD